MKLLILIDDYPSDENLYSNVFAHVRIKGYIDNGATVQVAITSKHMSVKDYIYEGVPVMGSSKIQDIKNLIESYNPDAILVHFAIGRIIQSILLKNKTIPTIIWVHGYEALGWYRRLFNFHPLKPKSYFKLASLIFRNTIQLFYFRKLISFTNKNKHISFIFVSEWMKKIASTDCFNKINNFSIIGNPIDNSLFSYSKKEDEKRFNLLMIRPFNSKKYGTDLVTEALLILKNTPIYHQLNITIYGKGVEKSKLYRLLKNDTNVHLFGTFVNQIKIKELHDENGIFLGISRQDAQGVSMCEALSSGLVVISSNNTAIPEYIPDNKAGLLTNNTPQDIANKISQVINDVQLFNRLSKDGSTYIQDKVGFKSIIQQELNIISKTINTKKE